MVIDLDICMLYTVLYRNVDVKIPVISDIRNAYLNKYVVCGGSLKHIEYYLLHCITNDAQLHIFRHTINNCLHY